MANTFYSELRHNFDTLFMANTIMVVLVTVQLMFTVGLLFYLDSLDRAVQPSMVVLRGTDTCGTPAPHMRTLDDIRKEFWAKAEARR